MSERRWKLEAGTELTLPLDWLIQTQPGTQDLRLFRPSADTGNANVGVAEDVDVDVHH